MISAAIAALAFAAPAFQPAGAAPIQVHPQARTELFIHVMPWFELGQSEWGWHWRMNRTTQELQATGRIASHYRPLIGPYDSADAKVVELQVLWMRVAGFDGVLADWYGTQPHFDYPMIHARTKLLFEQAMKARMKISVVYEDQTVKHALANGLITQDRVIPIAEDTGAFLKANWLRRPEWWRLGSHPVVMVFGPQFFGEAEWAAFRRGAGPMNLLTLHTKRPYSQGVYDWPVPSQGIAFNLGFGQRAGLDGIRVPVAFPRFHDWYEEGGQAGHADLPDDNGQTLRRTMDAALALKPPAVQVCTWNDWQEGTQIEPSVEYGYRDLEAVQGTRRRLDARFPFGPNDLELPKRLYDHRKAGASPALLEPIARAIGAGNPKEARRLLDALGSPGA